MTLTQLILRNLVYHWRGNLAVMLGVLVGGTVLTGALLVGDSLQGSLRDRALSRLGWVHQAVIAPRFFESSLGKRIEAETKARVSPCLLLQVTVTTGKAATRQVRGVTLLGVDSSFYTPAEPPAGFDPNKPAKEPFCFLNENLASLLEVEKGSKITIRLQKQSNLPRESVLARKELAFDDWEVPITRILKGEEPGNRFSLRPGLDEANNIVVPLSLLQQKLELPGKVNALLFDGETAKLQAALDQEATLEDRGLELHTPATRAKALLTRYDRNRDGVLKGTEWSRRVDGKLRPRFAWDILAHIKQAEPPTLTLNEILGYYRKEHPYLALQSKQLLLSPAVARSALEAAKEANLEAAPTSVYLCRLKSGETRVAGVVAALDPSREAPLGPFLPPGVKNLSDNEIVLVNEGWIGNKPAVGDTITLSFKPPESHGPAPDIRETFRLVGYVPMKGAVADPSLTPEFPGITDKDNAGDWTLPFSDPDWQQQVIRNEYTDAYWDNYRATPKAYISLTAGLKLWESRFGTLTSIRLAPRTINDAKLPVMERLDNAAKRFRESLRKRLTPAQSGLVLDDVRTSALAASKGGTPFGLLFLGFSFFLILSALLLVGLLYRLNLDRRANEVGVVFAVGYPVATTRNLLLGEGTLVALVGVIGGGIVALTYSRLLVQLLAYLWPGGVLKSFLMPHATVFSLFVGGLSALIVSVLTIAWVVRNLSRVPPRSLLAGQTTAEKDPEFKPASRWMNLTVWICVFGGVILLLVGPYVPGHEAQAGTFFGSGSLFLTAGLVGLLIWMKRARQANVEERGWWNIARLGFRNAARHPSRSLLTVGLLASAAFLLVAVESFRRHSEAGDGSIKASDGGFGLVAETDLPVIRDLNSLEGRRELLNSLRLRLVNQGKAPAQAEKEVQQAEKLLLRTSIFGLRARAGDDASCLNLYQPRSPRVLGVPRSLIEKRGGFIFDQSLAKSSEEKDNPWLVLLSDQKAIPAFGETNTVVWMLQSGLKGEVKVPDERGEQQPLLIAGLLHDSVFQSSLLVSEENFLRLYPTHEGYNYFLIQAPSGEQKEVRELLEAALADRGVEVTPTAEKVAAYLAVENTYLTTFQALGSLGLLLGSLGLAVVLLRSIWERRSELALLRALGWQKRTLGWLVLAENSYLLLIGLFLGTVAALLSILPQLLRGEGSVPVVNLLLLFAGVLVVAQVVGVLAVISALSAPIVPALRRE